MSNGNRQDQYTQSGQRMEQQQANGPNALVKEHKQFLEQRVQQIGKWVTQGVRPEALVRFALMDISQNDALRKCDPNTIYLGLLACAVTGLEPGALRGEAYLVPFAGKAQFMPGWKGLVKQARRSREVDAIVANVVRENDVFDIDLGTANAIIHKPVLRDRGPVIGAYAIATMKGGFRELEWLDREDLEKIKRVATKRAVTPAWKDWEDQMQRKSAIRRLAKRLPLGADYFVAMALEEADTDVEFNSIIDIETDGEASRTTEAAQRGESMREQANSGNGSRNAPIEVNSREDTRQQEPARQQQSAPAKADAKKDRYTKPKDEPKTNAEPAPDIKPEPTASGPANGMAIRDCFDCGVPIEVPANAPPGQKCPGCANQ